MSTAESNINRILVVDDNPSIHDDFRRIFAGDPRAGAADNLAMALLERSGTSEPAAPKVEFRLDHASQGQQALDLVVAAREADDPYALVYMDIRMPPGWNGFESTGRVLTIDPDVQIVLCTAYNDYGWEQRVEELPTRDRVLILKKPFDVIEVQQLANALCEKWRFARRDRERMQTLERTVQELAVANERLRQEIAERTRTQDALRKAQRLEGLGRLAAGVCHEINNPLCYIFANAQAIQDQLEPPSSIPDAMRGDLEEMSSAITIGAERITQIIRNIRIFARQSEAPIEFVELEEAIASAVTMEKQHLAADVELHVGPIDSTPVLGRRIELEQVLINLIENASHATSGQQTRPARITISTQREQDGLMKIEVADTGPGIDPETLEKIFDPFFTTKPVNKGTGLGLSICHSLIKGMSGTIDVRSVLGSGTTFTIRLPVASKPSVKQQRQAPELVRGSRVSARILIIDDEPFLLKALERLLKGCAVTATTSAREGLSLFTSEHFDLILCDMMMPDMTGRDFYRMLQKLSPGSEERIVFITGGASIEGIRQFLDEVPNRCIEKPFNSQLLAVITEEIESRAAAG